MGFVFKPTILVLMVLAVSACAAHSNAVSNERDQQSIAKQTNVARECEIFQEHNIPCPYPADANNVYFAECQFVPASNGFAEVIRCPMTIPGTHNKSDGMWGFYADGTRDASMP